MALARNACRRWQCFSAAAASHLRSRELLDPDLHLGRFLSALAGAEGQRSLIMQLRERTGAPMKDVKAALLQCQWDTEAAFTELRKKGLAAASKKASRVAAEGLLSVGRGAGATAIVEVNSETDFVARNDMFQHLVSRVAKAALSAEASASDSLQADVIDLNSLEAVQVVLDHPKLSGESTVRDAVAEAASILGENVKLRRGVRISSPHFAGIYLHDSPLEDLGRIAGLVTLEVEGGFDKENLKDFESFGNLIAMHVVASKPLFLSREHVDSTALQQERTILESQAATSGKPQFVIDKMVEGRLKKYYEEVALLEQKFIVNDTQNIQAVLEDLSNRIGKPVSIGRFLRMAVGEGIARQEKDFAAEVAAQQLRAASH